MQQDKFSKLKLRCFLPLMFVCAALFVISCKTANESLSDTNSDTISVAENDLNESNEDLLAVDYKQFYDELSPYGEWIEVRSDEVGVEIKPSSSNNRHYKEDELPHISIAALLGVKDAYAAGDVSTFFIWKPSADLAVGITPGEPPIVSDPVPTPVYVPPVGYTPYTNGEWVNTTEGWYFKAPTPHEEIVHHYGRWMNSPSLGWVWVPGRVRSPAWVDWREDDDYVAWTPIAPSVYIVNNVIPEPQVQVIENNYVVVEKKYFVEPQVYRYFYPETRIKVKGMKPIKGIVVRDRVIYDSGPDVVMIENHIDRKLVTVPLYTVFTPSQVVYNNTEMKVYSPKFKKVKIKGEKYTTVTRPQKFEKHTEIVEKIQKQRNQSASDFNSEDKKGHENNKQLEKNFNKKLGDDTDMRTGKQHKIEKNKKQNIEKKIKKEGNEKRDVIKDKAPKKDVQREVKKEKGRDKKNNDDNRKSDDKGKDKGNRERNKDRGKDKK